ncbi:hypothetical protein PNEG_01140 [Pneumocystis murina B123]|uniref:Uncharacterized protein n=1 Tax=Pneumocystis murina (strain B123) TaxID=1069680 RepID=M7PIZ7_PNEMU|nr:hypothetical protein PNEG_01140 [Pneumocystis murina B123]EMR10424.1 hypothetical protein PNEG_01140 [Pneumocystis murina B123]
MSVFRPKNTISDDPKQFSEKKMPISLLNTSTPAKIQKPKKIFVEDKATLLSILEEVNRRLDNRAKIKQEKRKELEAIRCIKKSKIEMRKQAKKNKKQEKWENTLSKIRNKKYSISHD